jgi:hypothetical protein
LRKFDLQVTNLLSKEQERQTSHKTYDEMDVVSSLRTNILIGTGMMDREVLSSCEGEEENKVLLEVVFLSAEFSSI